MNPIVIFVARALVAGVLCIDGIVAVAQTLSSSQPVSLAQAVEAAWLRTAESVEADGQLLRARADRIVATALWAAPPSLELAHRNDRLLADSGARETDVAVAVPLWLPGQRGARIDAARAGDEAALAAREAARLRITGHVREAVWNVALLRAEVSLAQAQTEALEALAADVDRRVAAGDLARADALAARSDAIASKTTLTRALTRLQVSLTRWLALTGLTDVPMADRPVERSSHQPLLEDHPLLRAARRNVELARKRLDAVLQSRRSAPELLVRLRTEVSSRAQSTQNSIGLGLRIPLATDDRNAPIVAAASADLDLTVATEQRLARQLQADIEVSRAETDAAESQIADQQTRAQLLRERATLMDRAFRAGEASLPEMLRVLSAVGQANAALERQRADAGLANARLQQALGVQP